MAPKSLQLETAKTELLGKLHVDPESGASWRSCQVTAISSMLDLKEAPTDATIVRYLLDAEENGTSPTSNTILNRLKNLGFSGVKSKNQAEGDLR